MSMTAFRMTHSLPRLSCIARALVVGVVCMLATSVFGADFKPDEIVVKLRTTTALAGIQTQLSVVQTIQFGSRPDLPPKLPGRK